MFEYAISWGEGTLLDYGIKQDEFLARCHSARVAMGQSPKREMVEHIPWLVPVVKIRFRLASPDCQTGQ